MFDLLIQFKELRNDTLISVKMHSSNINHIHQETQPGKSTNNDLPYIFVCLSAYTYLKSLSNLFYNFVVISLEGNKECDLIACAFYFSYSET